MFKMRPASLPDDPESKVAAEIHPSRFSVILLFFSAFLIAGGIGYYYHEKQQTHNDKYEDLAAIASLKVAQLQLWRKEIINDVQALANGPLFKRAVQDWLQKHQDDNRELLLRERLVAGRNQGFYTDALLVDSIGIILLAASDSTWPINESEQNALTKVVSSKNPETSDPYTQGGEAFMSSLAPILNDAGEVIAIGVYRINFNTELFPLIQLWPTPSKTAETLLVRRDGESVLFINNLRHHPAPALSLRESLSNTDVPAVKAVLGVEGMFEGKDYRGHEVLADLRPVTGFPWFLITKVDVIEILREVRFRGIVVLVFSILFFLMAASVTAYVYRNEQLTLYRNLYRSELEQRRSNEAFLRSEQHMSLALNAARAGSWTWDLRTGENTWSDQVWGLYGIDKNSCVPSYKAWLETIHPDDRFEAERMVQTAADSGTELNAEWRTKNNGVRQHWLFSRGQPIRDENGQVSKYIGIVMDISDRKYVEANLQLSERKYRHLIENLQAGVVVHDINTGIVLANEAAAKLLGIPLQTLAGRSAIDDVWNFVDEEGAVLDASDYPVNKVLANRDPISNLVAGFRKPVTEELIWVLVSAYPIIDVSQVIDQVVVTFIDITERRRAENVIRQSEELFRKMFQKHSAIMLIIDPESGALLEANGSAEQFYGYSRSELISMNIDKLNTLSADTIRLHRKSAALEETNYFVFPHKLANGEMRSVEINSSPVELEGRTVLFSIIHDITDKKRTEAEKAARSAISELFLNEVSLENVYQHVAEILNDTLDFPVAAVELYDAESADMTLVGVAGISGVPQGSRVSVLDSLSGLVLTTGTELCETKATLREDYRFPLLRYIDVETFLCVPLSLGKEVVGTLTVADQRSRSDAGLWMENLRTIATLLTLGIKRQETVEKLIHSEEKYRRIVDTANEGIWAMDAEFRTTFVNRRMSDMMGYHQDEMIGKRVDAFMFPDDLKDHETNMKLRSRGEDQSYERRFKRKDGGELWTIVSAKALKDENGSFSGSFAMFTDITERRLTEQALIENEHKLSAISQGALDGIILVNENGEISYWNAAAEKIFGYSASEVMGKCVHSLLAPPPHRESSLQCMKQFKATGQGSALGKISEFTAYRRTGQVIPVEMALSSFKMGNSWYAAGIVRDITERKLSEAKLLESEQRFRTVADFNYDWEYWISEDNKILYMSPSCERITGYSCEEFLKYPKLMEKIVYPDDRPTILDHFKLARKNGFHDTYTVDYRIIKKNGDVSWINHACRPVFDENGKPLGRRASNRDITDRKKLEEQFFQAQKMEAIGILAGGIAHDFNNILQVALGYAGFMLADKSLPEPLREDAQKIYDSSKRGADLVHRLLTFSRKKDVDLQILSLNDRIIEVRKMLQRTFPKMIQLKVKLESTIPRIKADHTQIDQVLLNLALNARDAMPDGGSLSFETSEIYRGFDDHIPAVEESKAGHYVLLKVIDTGMGMEEAIVQRIFEPFYTTKDIGKGTGLGLAMVHGIVQHHRGHILCISKLGEGTEFQVYFPVPNCYAETSETVLAEYERGGSETILLVDDEEFIRDLGSRFLSAAGYKVITASNGSEAINIYEKSPQVIDAVILDLIMPQMGGKQCFERLLQLNPEIKVLLASGYSPSEPLFSGAKAYLKKPYNPSQMLKQLREVLDFKTHRHHLAN